MAKVACMLQLRKTRGIKVRSQADTPLGRHMAEKATSVGHACHDFTGSHISWGSLTPPLSGE